MMAVKPMRARATRGGLEARRPPTDRSCAASCAAMTASWKSPLLPRRASDVHVMLQAHVTRRRSDVKDAAAGGNVPTIIGRGPVFQPTPWQMQCDGLRLTGRDADAVERRERLYRKLRAAGRLLRGAQIHLRHLVARHFAGIAQREAHLQPAVCGTGNLESRVLECRIRQAEAEGELRLDVLLVEPAIAHVDALGVGGLALNAYGRALGMGGIVGGTVLQPLRPGERQPAGRAHFAEQ